MKKASPAQVREFAVLLAAYSQFLAATKDIEEPQDDIERKVFAIMAKIKRLIKGNMNKRPTRVMSQIKGFDNLKQQYKESGVYPSKFLWAAHMLSDEAIRKGQGSGAINFATGVFILSAYVTRVGGLKWFPVVGKSFLFESTDALITGVMDMMVDEGKSKEKAKNIAIQKINTAIDVAESIVENIMALPVPLYEGVGNDESRTDRVA